MQPSPFLQRVVHESGEGEAAVLHTPIPRRRRASARADAADSDACLPQRCSEQQGRKLVGFDGSGDLNGRRRIARDAAGDVKQGVAQVVACVYGAAAGERSHETGGMQRSRAAPAVPPTSSHIDAHRYGQQSLQQAASSRTAAQLDSCMPLAHTCCKESSPTNSHSAGCP